jgi:hypothetical protein
LAQPFGAAKIHLPRLMQARHHVHPLPGQARRRDIVAVSAVAQQDVTGLEAIPQSMEEPQIVLVEAAQDHVQQRAVAASERSGY